jgi:heme/copper-type cytochrome/quinol oxidase subunit 4
MSKSHTAENFSRFVVAMIVVTIIVAALTWVFSTFDTKCSVGIPCHPDGQPAVVHY